MGNYDKNWDINEPIISRYGIQTWKKGKRTPEHLLSVNHNGISLNFMLNEARKDAEARCTRYDEGFNAGMKQEQHLHQLKEEEIRKDEGKSIFQELDLIFFNLGNNPDSFIEQANRYIRLKDSKGIK